MICLKFVEIQRYEMRYIWYITYSIMYTLHKLYRSYVLISHSDKNQHHMISAHQARQEYSHMNICDTQWHQYVWIREHI